MSEYFTQYIVPQSTSAVATPEAIVRAVQAMVSGGFLLPQPIISIAEVVRGKLEPREIVMSMGEDDEESYTLPPPTRSREPELKLDDIATLPAVVEGWSEFDVDITSRGVPARQPIELGSYTKGSWQREPRVVRLTVSVRSVPVRLSRYDSPDPDGWDGEPRFDEDSERSAPAIFSHPHLGMVEVPGAAVARFWVSIDPGKFIVPNPSAATVDACDADFVALLEKSFGCPFAQACDWS